jgi:hypothetical protein
MSALALADACFQPDVLHREKKPHSLELGATQVIPLAPS